MSDKHLWEDWAYQLKYGIDIQEEKTHWELAMPDVPSGPNDPGPDSQLFHAKNGSERQLKKDQQGKSRYQHSIDLHHLTLNEARKALQTALNHCQTHNQHLLLIVHGKGSEHNPSTLKRHVFTWCKQSPHILGCTSAPSNMGGAGALLVRLKKKR